MARGVGEVDRVVVGIAVAVQRLRVARLGDDGVGGDEPPQGRIVVPGVIEVQAGLGIADLASIAPRVEGGCVGDPADFDK